MKKRNLNKKSSIRMIVLIFLLVIIYCSLLGSLSVIKINEQEWTSKNSINSSATISNETLICNATSDQNNIEIVGDFEGGAIITWQDIRDGNWDIYAQKIDSNGIVQWDTNGNVICNAENIQERAKISSDGEGGAIITWQDIRDGNWDIYAQKIDSNGVVQWDTNGNVICNILNNQRYPNIISDDEGGAIITWQDNRSGNWDIYAQKIDSNGIVQWDTNGNIICNAKEYQSSAEITSGENEGAILTWYDGRNGNWDIYAQKIDSNGVVQWEDNGTLICNEKDTQQKPSIATDGNKGAIITWEDKRGDHYDIYAQKIDSNGVVQWEDNGTLICNEINAQATPKITDDGENGAIISWIDDRNFDSDIFAQRINSTANIKWLTNGTLVSNATSNQRGMKILRSELGKAVIVWIDARNGNMDIYAKLITYETKATNGGGKIPGFNPLILVLISIITLFTFGVHKRKKTKHSQITL